MIGIHPVHRKMAEVIHMSRDAAGNVFIGVPEIQLLVKYALTNYKIVTELDKLKHLALHAYEMGDMEWLMNLTAQIDALEVQLI